ncbi:M10 family metallopeptidase C-terminal domain-containing protein [Pseudomonas syringae]|uniref:M10 family metallopeptidase C-terminal domain-containing protein n=1 Tax=Pseudomonas syringae TaxID=317 RepID=UPI003BF9C976
MQHAVALDVFTWSAFVDRQFANLDQACARDVAGQAQQAGCVHLVVVAEAIGGSEQRILDLLVQGTGLFFKELLKRPVEQLLG